MDDDTIFILGMFTFIVIIIGLVCFPVVYIKNKDVELEKFKIEMQVKHGDIGNLTEEE